jgi:beta-galactosidase
MKTLLSALALATLAAAQPPAWFPPDQLLTIGVYYYPEAWPQSQWDRDLTNISNLGFEYIHMAEFSWAFLEPTEGHYDFSWLDRVVSLAQAHHLKVVLCTPTATPPAWLSRQHPEILMVRADGTRMDHGSREQADWSSPVYLRYVEDIDNRLAEHYGSNPTVIGWQLDNELSHYSAGISYSEAAQQRFRAFLREKYGSIDRLNTDWGNSFWSQMYNSFDQIRMPNPHDLVASANPHAMLDLHRWFASETAAYLRFQANVLRRHIHNQWVTTNFMMNYNLVDPALSARDLDILTFTMYPVSGGLFEGPLGFRIGSPAAVAFTHDYLRNLGNGIEGPMELQPGQVNWAPVNPWPLPGVIHSWILRTLAAGGRLVCTYRYRQPLAGDELYHKAIVEPDGVTLAPGGKEFKQAIDDIRAIRPLYKPNLQPPADYAARRTAFLISFANRWDIDNHPQTNRWDTTGHWHKYYRALKSMMAPVDVITEDKDFSSYKFLIAPAYQLIGKNLVSRWETYARNGGTLILTCRTGQMDRRGHIWESLWAQPIYNLAGAAIPRYDVLPNGRNGHVTYQGKSYEWGSWADLLEPESGTETLATYADQFYRGAAAATRHKFGKGQVIYIGVDTLDGRLETAILHQIYSEAGVHPASLAPDFLVDWRDGFWVATNFTSDTQTIPAPAAAKILRGTRNLPPGGAAIWQQ